MSRFKNRRKEDFINKVHAIEDHEQLVRQVDHVENNISKRMSFNFSYFLGETPGADFNNLDQESLSGLFIKLREFCRQPISNWLLEPIGHKGTVFANYINFPKNSDFEVPAHVPKGVEWGRFRIDRATRLAGFIVPDKKNGIEITKGYRLCNNVFYVVFLDLNHGFYKTGPAKKK
ncbi:hypothetical protein [Enterobacter cloacae]|uniref:hypothetical protein n=1 Tax=Enterobacter cloacae TaxID=550 RepID=UPI00254FC0A0|nr:hypothetical protein [Enterobacter cloacae]